MSHLHALRGPRLVLASVVLGALAAAAGCTVSVERTPTDTTPDPNEPSADAGTKPAVDGSTSESDAGTDAEANADACADGGCAEPVGCAARPGASFCDDFDNPEALTPNKTKWDFIEPSEQPVATLSSVRAVSAPSSLLSQVIDRDTPGAKFVKTITKAGFTQVTWEYDIYFDSIGTEDGFFLDDLQFSDAAGPDSFGFRLVMFAKAGAIGELKVEHNRGATGGSYVIEPALAEGTVALGKWHHFAQTVKFTFGAGGDAGQANRVEYSLHVDGATLPAFKNEYPGPTREQATFARIAGMPLVFNKEKSAGLKIHWDNHVLEMK
jgi:hypothetical protein